MNQNLINRIAQLTFDESDLEQGIDFISLVEFPAIESDFIAFNKEGASEPVKNEFTTAVLDDEKRILIGAAMIPNKLIYRKDSDGTPWQCYFSKGDVRKMSQFVMKNNRIHNANLEHETPVKGVYIVENWIIEEPTFDKAFLYGFDFPAGTWMVSMHVENDEVWESVKEGKLRGFSIEGYFVEKLVKFKA